MIRWFGLARGGMSINTDFDSLNTPFSFYFLLHLCSSMCKLSAFILSNTLVVMPHCFDELLSPWIDTREWGAAVKNLTIYELEECGRH